MRKIGYARVSTKNQSLTDQVEKLLEYGCEEVFEDYGVSGAINNKSEAFKNLMKTCSEEPCEVVVAKLDRFGRSTTSILENLDLIMEQGCHFSTLDGAFSYKGTDDIAGKVMRTVLALMADLERQLIKDRTTAGRNALKAKGYKVGRKPALTAHQVSHVRYLHSTGSSVSEIATEFNASRNTIYKALQEDYVDRSNWEAHNRNVKFG